MTMRRETKEAFRSMIIMYENPGVAFTKAALERAGGSAGKLATMDQRIWHPSWSYGSQLHDLPKPFLSISVSAGNVLAYELTAECRQWFADNPARLAAIRTEVMPEMPVHVGVTTSSRFISLSIAET